MNTEQKRSLWAFVLFLLRALARIGWRHFSARRPSEASGASAPDDAVPGDSADAPAPDAPALDASAPGGSASASSR